MDSVGNGYDKQADPTDVPPLLRRPGGEFLDPALEAAFGASRDGENHRHARTLLVASIILNTLFFASDARFFGTPHFWIAIPARALVVVAAVTALFYVDRCRTAPQRQRGMVGWMIATALGVAALVSSRSDIATFVVVLLPTIYYLAVPVSFRWRTAGGAGCSLAMLAGYEAASDTHGTAIGIILTMLVLNVAMTIVVSRSNRLERLGWLAMRAERRTSAELAASREQIEKMFAASPVPMIVTARDDGRLIHLNDCARNFIGARGGQTMIADFYADLGDRAHILALLDDDGEVRNFEMKIRIGDGAMRTVLVNASMIDHPEGPLVISGIIDITDRKANEQDLKWLASTDALTGLANRTSFFATGRSELMRAGRTGTPLALLMIDLDHFKQVNDSFGHHGGDEALRGFAATCRTLIGDAGLVARLGGEEFGVLLRNVDGEVATAIAERLCRAVQDMVVEVGRGTIRLTASIGVAEVEPRDRNLDPALARADAALYAAKHAGRNRVVLAAEGIPARRAG